MRLIDFRICSLLDLAVGLADHARSSRSAVSRSPRWPSSSSTCATASRVLLLRERVHGAELLAAALQPLDARPQRRVALLVRAAPASAVLGAAVERSSALRDAPQLQLGLGGLVAHALRRDLGRRDRLALAAQLDLDLRLLGRARAQLGGGLLARLPVVARARARARDAVAERLAGAARARRPSRRRAARARGRPRAARAAARPAPRARPLGAAPLRLAALGGELALELRLAHRQRTLAGARPPLLDQPLGAPHRLARLHARALGVAERLLGLGDAPPRRRAPPRAPPRARPRAPLLLRRPLGLPRSAGRARCAAQHHARCRPRRAGAARPRRRTARAPRAWWRSRGSPRGRSSRRSTTHASREQALREREHPRRPARQLEQPLRARAPGGVAAALAGALVGAAPPRRAPASSATPPSGPAPSSTACAPARRPRAPRRGGRRARPRARARSRRARCSSSLERLRARLARRRRAGVAAQELVGGGELRAHPLGLAPRVLRLALRRRASRSRAPARPRASACSRASRGRSSSRPQLLDAAPLALALALAARRSRARARARARTRSRASSRLERAHARLARRAARAAPALSPRLAAERRSSAPSSISLRLARARAPARRRPPARRAAPGARAPSARS